MGICLHPLLLVLNKEWENICLRYSRVSQVLPQKKRFAALVNEPQHKEDFIKQITMIALSATIIPLSIFTQFFHWRFSKHIYLETSLEMLQQAYIAKETESKDYYLIPGDTCCILWNALVVENALALLGRLEKLYIMHLLPLYATGASLTLTNLQVNWICYWCQCYLAVCVLTCPPSREGRFQY